LTLSSRRGVTPGAARPARALVMAAEETVAVPLGMKRYETMFLMLPDASEDELAKEIAKWESLLLEHGAAHVETLNRGRQPVAYSIKGFPEVVYVQFNYVAPGLAAKALETELAAPVLGDRKLVMRFMTKLY
jgi:ribosomal protein S6